MVEKALITHSEKKSELRLNKFISEKGLCSRREADAFIEGGRVLVNGEVAVVGMKISDADEVVLDGKVVSEKKASVYIVLNKPVGITCTTEKKIKGNIVDFINYTERIFPIGRLDKDSQGLILLTNDGDIVNKILRAGNNHEKEYIVTTDSSIDDGFLKKMASGVSILGTVTKPCKVVKLGKNVFNITLTQGLNRQIRRMCSALGKNVVKLERVRIMNIFLENLPLGKWRYLTTDEMKELNRLISDSVKTEEASNI